MSGFLSTNTNLNMNVNISNEYLLLINILNNMYNDNLRQINLLTEYNNDIRNTITSILYPRQSNGVRNRTRNSNQNIFRNNTTVDEYSLTVPLFDIRLTDLERSNTNADTNNLMGLFRTFFEPVEVYPTQSQIEAATRRVRYCDIVTPRNRSCPISLENFSDNDMVTVIRHCGHIFNTEQLNTWFRSHCACPVCRYDIRNFNDTAASSGLFNTDTDVSNNLLQQETSRPQRRQSNTNNISTENVERSIDAISQLVNSNNVLNTFRDISGNDLSDPQTLYNLISAFRRRR
jgi:hypothetical protein